MFLARSSRYLSLCWVLLTSVQLRCSYPHKAYQGSEALHEADQKAFDAPKFDEIDFLLKACVIPISIKNVPDDVELKVLKLIFSLKTSSANDEFKRHRALLVSESHKSSLHHSVHGNSPIVMLSTVCMIAFNPKPPKDWQNVHFLPQCDKVLASKLPQQTVDRIQATSRIIYLLSAMSQPRITCMY